MCWDVYENASPEKVDFWRSRAQALLGVYCEGGGVDPAIEGSMLALLREVAKGSGTPTIDYRVSSLEDQEVAMKKEEPEFGLVYSQAGIEHIWKVDQFWDAAVRLTQPGGWHSHRIDLADHDSRETNYIEMLLWSRLSYWLTMRFIPGAINRWCASQHQEKLESLGMQTLLVRREMRKRLPIPQASSSAEFGRMGEVELRCTALDIVSRKRTTQC